MDYFTVDLFLLFCFSRDLKKQEALWIYSLQVLNEKERINQDFLIGLNIEDMTEENRALVEEAMEKLKSSKKK